MGDKISIELAKRDIHGKKVSKLRREGMTPGVVYGAGFEPISVQVDASVIGKVVQTAGFHAPVHITVDGKKKIAMIKDVDFDPVKHQIRNVAFHAVNQNQPVEAEVAIHLIGEGESEAERAGLVVLQALDRIEIKALPMDLPEAVEIDIRGLKESGDKVTLGDAKLPSGVEFVEHESHHGDEEESEKQHITDLMVASVWEPAALQAANEAAAGDATAADAEDVPSEEGEKAEEKAEAKSE
jgi:large subunit ribosomal protein L25